MKIKLMYLVIFYLDTILWLIQKIYYKLNGCSGWVYITLFNVKWITKKGYKLI